MIHYTAMQSAAGAIRHLCTPEAQVSAHYVISAQGQISALVPEHLRAWHAGAASWGGEADVNSRSIGIELANDGASPFGAGQMDALEGLLGQILGRWSIPPKGVIAHSDVAPGRKIDPGARFDWRRLALRGLAVWPRGAVAEAPSAQRFRGLLGEVGYTADVADGVLLAAFRLRFRPWGRGGLGAEDMALAQALARDFPVDPVRREA